MRVLEASSRFENVLEVSFARAISLTLMSQRQKTGTTLETFFKPSGARIGLVTHDLFERFGTI